MGRSYFTVSSSRDFCNSFLTLFCFSVLNAAETEARLWFLWGGFEALAQHAPQRWSEESGLSLGAFTVTGHLSNTGLDRQSDFN